MNTGRTFLVLCLTVLLAGAIWLTAGQSAAKNTRNGTDQEPSWERIDRAAHNVRSSDDTPIRTLADEVFAHHGIDQAVPIIAPSMKDRLVAAEVDYQKGKSEGITEDRVVATVNHVAQRLNAPPYAFTSAKEVKRLRVRMLTIFPSLIGRGSAAARDASKPTFEPAMSPLEAFHVTATLIHQKVFNPDFQLSEQEAKEASAQEQPGVSLRAKGNSNGERTKEMLAVLQQGTASMSATDLLEQGDRSLDLLGIHK